MTRRRVILEALAAGRMTVNQADAALELLLGPPQPRPVHVIRSPLLGPRGAHLDHFGRAR
jgi:hypothetical protein